MPGVANILRALERLEAETVEAALRGLHRGASQVQSLARNSGAYQDQSGATRSATVAYAASATVDDGGVMTRALAEVAVRNPGHEASEEIPTPGAGELVVVLTVPTDYQHELSVRSAGAFDALGPAMDAGAPGIADAAGAAIARVWR